MGRRQLQRSECWGWGDKGDQGIQGPQGPSGTTGGIAEAPNDGVQYARQSLAWTPVAPPAGGGKTEVFEFANLAAFPATGVTATIYVAQDTSKIYHWVDPPPSGGALSVEAVSAIAHNDSAAVLTNTITTLTPNAIIILVWQTNAGTLAGPPTAPGLTFALGFNGPPGNANVGYFWAKAATPGTYTITSTGSFAAYFSAVALSVAGAPSANFDGSPVYYASAEPLAYTPTNPNELVFVSWVVATDNPTAGAGWTQIAGQNFWLAEYQIISSTAPVSATIGAGAGNGRAGVIHGLMAG